MRIEWIFPTALVAQQLVAAAIYAAKGQAKGALYWLLAAALSACVTYMKG